MLAERLQTAGGTQQALADTAEMSQSALADLLNGRTTIDRMRLGTLLRLFPDLDVTFFAWQRPSQEASDLAHAYDAMPARYRERLQHTLAEIRRDRDREEAAACRQRPDAASA